MTDNQEADNQIPAGTEPAAAAAATDPETPQVPYQVVETRKEEGSVLRYEIETERAGLDAQMEEVLRDLRKTVVLDGFRPGKAPVQLLKNRFGKDAQKDALNELAGNIALQIVKADDLEIIGEPKLEESTVEEGRPVRLVLHFEVHPKVEAEGYTGGSYEVEVAPVTEELVEKQLQHIREANATYEAPAEPKPFEKGDGATLDMHVTDKTGQPLQSLCREGVFMRDPFAGLMPEVAADLVGRKPGESFTRTVSRTVKNRVGEEVVHEDTYAVTLREVKVRKEPALDDDFAKDVGEFDNLEALRQRIRVDLAEQYEREKRQQAVEKIFTHLIASNPFDAPRTIVAAQEYETIMRDSNQLQRMGMSIEDLGMNTEAYLKTARVNSERFVKINLLINAIGRKEQIAADEADLQKEIERRAEAEGRKPLAIRAKLEAEKRLDAVRRELLIDKVEDYLMAQNTVTVIEPRPKPAAE